MVTLNFTIASFHNENSHGQNENGHGPGQAWTLWPMCTALDFRICLFKYYSHTKDPIGGSQQTISTHQRWNKGDVGALEDVPGHAIKVLPISSNRRLRYVKKTLKNFDVPQFLKHCEKLYLDLNEQLSRFSRSIE